MLRNRYVLVASALVALLGCSLDEREVVRGAGLQGQVGVAGPDAGGGSARLEVFPSTLDFGRVATGFQARGRITLSNSGDAPLAVPVVSWATQDADFGLLQNQCLAPLKPGEHCELRVSLLPSRASALSAALRIDAQEGGSLDVSMAGEGLLAGNLILAPTPGYFEDLGRVLLGSSGSSVFAITNSGSSPTGPLALYVNRPEFVLAAPSGLPGECILGTTSLEPGQACEVNVSFNPAERGQQEATLTAEAATGGSISTRLAGEGLAPGALVAGVSELDFEGVVLGDGALRALAFVNDGDEALTLVGSRLEPAAAEAFSIESSDCGAGRVLEAGAACLVQIEFRPGIANQELTAELVTEAIAAAAPLRVALRGTGLEPGRLELAAEGGGETDFGEVLLESTASRVVRVVNPTAQPSGVLDMIASEGFAVAPSASPEACVAGSTSLGEGQSCTIEVLFTPPRRELFDGSLTVSSALTGAKSLALAARGIIPAAVQVASELDFGRVFTNAPSSRPLTITNVGDQGLPPPTFAVAGENPATAAAFSFTSTCAAELLSGASCEVSVSFAPAQALPHAANLTIASATGAVPPVLLLGEGLVPGSLVLAAAEGETEDFGDSDIGVTVSTAFTLTNPGSIPSGPLVFRTDDVHFVVSQGDCNTGDPAGLVDGASCTFEVQFAPTDSSALTANLSVQSTGAGVTGVELTGRGRRPATLEGTGNKDLGRANVGQAALTIPENEFVWTLNNTGDRASGALRVTNDNGREFVIGNDACNGVAVPGAGSCSLTIRFTPGVAGVRNALVTVADPMSDQSLPLALTGTGVQLAALGQSCVNAECAAGECTGGVCCDRACEGTCQECIAGVCTDQSNREACGQGGARCFGVDRCLLPEGEPCGLSADCGSGNCEQRLGGQGQADAICCLGDCSALGQQCNAAGTCEQPTAADGALCNRAGDLPCGDGLVCKTCGDGASRCKAPADCCDTCQAPLVCVGGAGCDCPPQPNGGPSIDCGGGLCIPSREGACCPETPDCPLPGQPNCDPTDFLCKECVINQHCPTGQVCQGGSCSCPQGTTTCGDGSCIPAGACCQDCGGGQDCINGSCQCPGGSTLSTTGQCQIGPGQICGNASGLPCSVGFCVGAQDGASRCCNDNCPGNCTATGSCDLPSPASLSAGDLSFFTVEQNTTTSVQATISNDGEQATGTLSFDTSSGDLTVDSSSCGSIAGGSSCQITVSFTPSASGAAEGSIVVSSGGANLLTFGMTANVTPPEPGPAVLSANPAAFALDANARVGGWVISNTGESPSDPILLDGTNDTDFSATPSDCGVLAADFVCGVSIRFDPATPGIKTGTFRARTAAGVFAELTVTGDGTGLFDEPPVVVAPVAPVDPGLTGDPAVVPFGTPGALTTPPTDTWVISSTGRAESVTISAPLGISVMPTICPVIEPGAPCFIIVTFLLGDQPGLHQETVTATDSNGFSVSVDVTGTGEAIEDFF